ncbi:hypothetical protein [Enhygromyxa salina]|uniref:Lipoprotein n=1 Tax=Enhygromyxa salina TaxID=215803 RepID=A0A2S9YPI6_9BACT|nr:hypothetical protein [Enhygromyxa salina]PRQ06969.1 hypothetical protein ENSA7_33030 [Enhygromyxa salina]
MRQLSLCLATSVFAGSLLGCAALRQNMRGQELSYRGAWHCGGGACKPSEMVKSTSGTRDGTVNINTVKLDPKAGMAFTAAAPFEQLVATVTDCKGKQVSVPERDIVRPGKHGLSDQDARESWIVWVDPTALSKLERGAGSCAVWKVEATATWADGVTYSLTAGVDLRR